MARDVVRLITAHEQLEGGGFKVRRPFPTQGLDFVDPLLMLDEMGPAEYGPGEAVGAPDHPHRGFETVTYLVDGAFEHRDSGGHHGVLRPGDVQWMTAGDGVVHSEMPTKEILEKGGRVHGFQLWVNLPRADKRIAPRYQDIPREQIPEATSEDGRVTVRVIAGEALGVSAVIDTRTPIVYLHWKVQPGGATEVAIPADFNAFVYAFEGALEVAGQRVERGQLALLGDGESVALGSADGGQALLIGGRPLDEPVAWGGPFVMNTREEVYEAFRDYQQGRMGRIAPQVG